MGPSANHMSNSTLVSATPTIANDREPLDSKDDRLTRAGGLLLGCACGDDGRSASSAASSKEEDEPAERHRGRSAGAAELLASEWHRGFMW